MKPSATIRAYAAKIASTNPEIAFDLANLSAKIAQEEKEEKKDDDKEEGKPFPGAAKPFEKKEAQDEDKKQSQEEPKEQAKQAADDQDKKQAEDEEKKEEEQAKQAYTALRSACIRTAASNPQARAALTPVLQLIKQIG